MDQTDLLESSLSWSEFWATMACGAVAVGLVIEYHSDFKSALVKRNLKLLPLGALLVTLGVALEFAFQIRTSVLISEVRGIQQKQASDATERAAKAEKAAAEAQLALSKMNTDRVLTESQIGELVKILHPFAGSTFSVATEKGKEDVDSRSCLVSSYCGFFLLPGGRKKSTGRR